MLGLFFRRFLTEREREGERVGKRGKEKKKNNIKNSFMLLLFC